METSGMKVGEMIAMLEADGWAQVRMRGSHRQFKHPWKTGTVTVAGKLSADIPAGTYAAIRRQAGLRT
jgi:predicted RNA binding protein YcfA (HicA-like mRNA interferase family)